MKRISRARLRGKPLYDECKKAHTTTHEYGPADNRVFCYGLFNPLTDEPLERCKICGAFVRNETPLEETLQNKWIFEPGKIPKCPVCGRYSDDADTGEAIVCPFCGAKLDYDVNDLRW